MLKLFNTFLKSTFVGATSILLLSPLAEAATTLQLEIEKIGSSGPIREGELSVWQWTPSPLVEKLQEVYGLDQPPSLTSDFVFGEGWFSLKFVLEEGEGWFDLTGNPGELTLRAYETNESQEEEDWNRVLMEMGAEGECTAGMSAWDDINCDFGIDWVLEEKEQGREQENELRETTPEPSLILGFITVGGLILGSRKKEKA